MRRRILLSLAIALGLGVIWLVFLIPFGTPTTTYEVGIAAYKLSDLGAVDCGDYFSDGEVKKLYPSPADACAVMAFKAGKSFRAKSCYWRTDTAGCYSTVGTSAGEVFFFFYTEYGISNTIGKSFTCTDCEIKFSFVKCPAPIVGLENNREMIQCPAFPASWHDTFHIWGTS